MSELNNATAYNRRDFLKLSTAAGGGLLLGLNWLTSSCSPVKAAPADWHYFNAYLHIGTDGSVIIWSPNPEVGQGVRTSMPLIVAEELDVDWASVKVEQASLDADRFTRQVAGGSGSIRHGWETLRKAGATARQMLIQAAANQWKVPAEECTTEAGVVKHSASGQEAPYGELAAAAGQLEPPAEVKLKDPAQFKLIGKAIAGVDNHDIITGKPLFGIDTYREGMLYAVVARPPAFGQKLFAVDDAAAKQVPGVRQVIHFDDKVAVLADHTWAALQGRKALKIEWASDAPLESSAQHTEKMLKKLEMAEAEPRRRDGQPEQQFKRAARTVEATYSCPLLPHNTMEPMNFFAHVQADQVELLGPTQTPARARSVVAEFTGIAPEKISVQMTRMGGGFGRRLEADFVLEAAKISQLAKAPVKVQWTREDDMGGGIYRPACYYRYRAALNADGKLTAFHLRGAGINVGNPVRENNFPAGALPHLLMEGHDVPSAVTTGPWRAPVHNFLAFAEQAFLDEVALAAGKDAVAFRLELLRQAEQQPVGTVEYNPKRFRDTIELAAQKSGWGQTTPQVYRGFSAYYSFQTYVAIVAEVAVVNGQPKLETIYCAVDCGQVVNQSGAEQQVVGGIVDGLGHAMYGQLSIENGAAVQQNFDAYRIIRIQDAPPKVAVFFVDNDEAPTGLGEPALPPTAAAVANAMFAATGQRWYHQPFAKAAEPVAG